MFAIVDVSSGEISGPFIRSHAVGEIISSLDEHCIGLAKLTLNFLIGGVQIPLLTKIHLEIEWFLTSSIVQNKSIFTESAWKSSSNFPQTIFSVWNWRAENVGFQVISVFALAALSQ